MRVLIIHPRSESRYGNQLDFRYLTKMLTGGGYRGGTSIMGCIPLALPTLAALTPSGVRVRIIDEQIEKIDFTAAADVVAIAFITLSAKRAYEIADAFRARGVHVVLGGIHASLFPDEAARHADTVVIGEAEETWPRFIDDFKRGQAQKRYWCDDYPELDAPVVPRWDLLKNRFYITRHVQTSRGCPFDCDFCGVRTYLGTPRFKPLSNVMREIEAVLKYNRVPGLRPLMFSDDNIIADRRYARELFHALRPLRVSWASQCSINIARDEELLDMASMSGCRQLLIGLESVSQVSLNGVNKGKLNRIKDFRRALDAIHARRIVVIGMFVLGLDGDGPSVFDDTAAFVHEANILFPVFNILTPIPGTRLHASMARQKRILHDNWAEYCGSTVCFKPKKLTPRALQEGFFRIQKELYAPAAFMARLTRARDTGALPLEHAPFARRAVLLRLGIERLLQRGETKGFIGDLLRFMKETPTVPVETILTGLAFHVYARDLPLSAADTGGTP